MGRKDDIKPRKTDRRTIYTRNVIKDALLEAMKEKAFEQITVTDVCRRAEVTLQRITSITNLLTRSWTNC